MNDYAEKRDFYRMCMECPAHFRIQDTTDITEGTVKNLSATGVLIVAPREISPGTRLRIQIVPAQAITPPLSATASVVRSSPAGEGRFEIACTIERILSVEEVGSDFP